MDFMHAAFPNDETSRMAKVQIDEVDFERYSQDHLWRDGAAELASWPRYESFKSVGLVVSPNDFVDHMKSYWSESSFKLTAGRRVVLDLVLYLGRSRSTAYAAELPAFKLISTTIMKQEIDSLCRFKEVEPAYVSFFHVFEADGEGVLNIHSHNLLFLT